MNFTDHLTHDFRSIAFTLGMFIFMGLTACGGGGGDGPVVDAVVTGYYDTGTAQVKETDDTTDLFVNDLQALAHNNRLILMSISQGLIFDGTISISGNGFTGTLNVYRDGQIDAQNLTAITVSGTINQGSLLSGNLNGVGAANGSFSVNYALSNNQMADLPRIYETNANPEWTSPVGGASDEIGIQIIDPTGAMLSTGIATSDGTLRACEVASGAISPINGTALYSITLDISLCNPATAANTEGNRTVHYTGLAASQSAADNVLVMIFTHINNTFAFGGDYR